MLLHEKHAKSTGLYTNRDASWAPGPDIFLKNGFQHVGDAPNSFNEMIREKWAK